MNGYEAKITVGELAYRYCDWQAGRVSRVYMQAIGIVARALSVTGDMPAGNYAPGDFLATGELLSRPISHHRQRRVMPERLSQSTVGNRMNLVVEIFRWGAGEGLVSPRVYNVLMDVPGVGLKRVRRVGDPTAIEAAEATLPFVPLHLRAPIQLAVLADLEPREVAEMRLADIDRSLATGTVRARCRQCRKGDGPCPRHAFWLYRSPSTRRVHKLDPKAQALLAPAVAGVGGDAEAYLFPSGRDTRRKFDGGRFGSAILRARDAAAAAGVTVPAWSLKSLRGFPGVLLDVNRPADAHLSDEAKLNRLIPFAQVEARLPWVRRPGTREATPKRLRKWRDVGVLPTSAGRSHQRGLPQFAVRRRGEVSPIKLRCETIGGSPYTSERWLREYFTAVGWTPAVVAIDPAEVVEFPDVPGRFPVLAMTAEQATGRKMTGISIRCWVTTGLVAPNGERVRLATVPNSWPLGVSEVGLFAFFEAMGWPTDGRRVERTAPRREDAGGQRLARPHPTWPGVLAVPLQDGTVALIDATDRPLVDGWFWSWVSGRVERRDRERGSVGLARLILGLTDPSLAAWYANGDRRDLRRANLSVVTRAFVSRQSARTRAGLHQTP